DHSLQRLLIDGAHKPFTVGAEIRTPWRQDNWLHPARLHERIERLRVLGITIVDQIVFAQQEALKWIRQLSGALLHKGGSGVRCDARDVDAPRSQLDDEGDIVRHESVPCRDLA